MRPAARTGRRCSSLSMAEPLAMAISLPPQSRAVSRFVPMMMNSIWSLSPRRQTSWPWGYLATSRSPTIASLRRTVFLTGFYSAGPHPRRVSGDRRRRLREKSIRQLMSRRPLTLTLARKCWAMHGLKTTRRFTARFKTTQSSQAMPISSQARWSKTMRRFGIMRSSEMAQLFPATHGSLNTPTSWVP